MIPSPLPVELAPPPVVDTVNKTSVPNTSPPGTAPEAADEERVPYCHLRHSEYLGAADG